MAKTKTRTVFVCQKCGAQRSRWEGRCTDCGAWNSLVEETPTVNDTTRGWALGSHHEGGKAECLTLDQQIAEVDISRIPTGFVELDRVLGGGLVPGSFLLVGGDPGIGKSTLLLQMAGGLAKGSHHTLYISGEESVQQTALRAQRLGIRSQLVEIACESNLDTILQLAKAKRPQVIVVDSIQTVFLSEISSAPGSVTQVRECAARLMALAKTLGITVFLVGHITKDGSIAGPKVLEHMVDTVLSFEGDSSHQFRLLRAIKNRFGATHELGVFHMQSGGLAEVANPSELFLEERGDNLIGSAVFAAMEGSRPLLCEIQALATHSPLAMPRRTSLGFDLNRVHLLIAVLDKHLNLNLATQDVFINVVGGLKIMEPAADLAIAAALISSEGYQEIGAKTIFFGEVGLTGEVRAVPFADLRIKEAQKLGFETFILPTSNKKHLSDLKLTPPQSIHWVKKVSDLMQMFPRKKKQ